MYYEFFLDSWTILGELKYARSHFPSVGILNSSLIVTAGKLDISWKDRNLGQQTVEIFKVTFFDTFKKMLKN